MAYATTSTYSAKDVMSTTAPYLSSARDQLDALRRGETTSRALLDQLLKHHAKVNPSINAVVTLDIEGARRRRQGRPASHRYRPDLRSVPTTQIRPLQTASVQVRAVLY
ncbi:hypothetical protein ACWGDT_07465 [Streptomyces avermitilis]